MGTMLKEQLDKLSTDFRWGVAIDGSTMALKGLKVAIMLMKEGQEEKKPKVEKVHCLHVENPSKQDTVSLTSTHFRNSAKLIFDQETFVEMKWHQSQHSATNESGIFAQLECMARDNKVNLLVVGTFGLNGEKKNKIGRMTSFSMANSQTPVMIVKPTYKITAEDSRSFLVCVDGQGASNRALLFALKYIVRKKDKVILFYKNSVDETKGFFTPYVKLLEELGVGHQTKFSSDKSMNVAAEIVHVAKELETEFIVMGKKRTRTEVLLGSISDHVAARTRSSLIICKDIAFE